MEQGPGQLLSKPGESNRWSPARTENDDRPWHSFEVEIIGEITKMLTLPDENIDLHESSTKVVAGARKQRESLILPVRL